MIQYYLDLEKQVKAVEDARLAGGQIQKIYSTAYYISMAIRVPGKTWHLYLGRGSSQEGLWLHDVAPPAALRRRDNFLEYFRRHLSSCTFLRLELDRSDRVLAIHYQKFGQQQSLLLFWKGRKLYFLHHYQPAAEAPFRLLLSWSGKTISLPNPEDDLFSLFDEVGRKSQMDHDLASPESIKIEDLLKAEQATAGLKAQVNNPQFLHRKKNNIEDDLRRARQWEKLQAILDRQEQLDGLYELKVEDQKIKFESDLNSYERRDVLFQKIKKLKRGESILQDRLRQTEEQLQGQIQREVLVPTLPIVKPVWGKEVSKNIPTVQQPGNDEYRIYKLGDFHLGIGLSNRGNDQLRNKWAGKDDWWIHLDGIKSAHGIVKLLNDSAVTSDMLNLGATLVALQSGFMDDWIPIIYTQVKNLKGVTGSAGMVIYKKEKHLKCHKVDTNELLKD
jgi:predicted ribosome quality control (RQC) complex YloA/Tae2 family protein